MAITGKFSYLRGRKAKLSAAACLFSIFLWWSLVTGGLSSYLFSPSHTSTRLIAHNNLPDPKGTTRNDAKVTSVSEAKVTSLNGANALESPRGDLYFSARKSKGNTNDLHLRSSSGTSTNDLDLAFPGHSSDLEHYYTPSFAREKSRRRPEMVERELWSFFQDRVGLLKNLTLKENSSLLLKLIENFQEDFQGYHVTMQGEFHTLRHVDKDEEFRRTEAARLGDLVQRRLQFLQNPPDCDRAKLLVCDVSQGCGFACNLHHVTYCQIMAYGTGRTLVLQDKMWRYSKHGWTAYFRPLSQTCLRVTGPVQNWDDVDDNTRKSARVLRLPIINDLKIRPHFLPLAIPEDLAPRLSVFHGDPGVWWIAQVMRYVARPNKKMLEYVTENAKRIGFQRPIVGLHVRRTDKVAPTGESKIWRDIQEYMVHVQDYYRPEHRRPKDSKPRIYLATDDPNLLEEAIRRYPEYHFIGDSQVSESAAMKSRYSDMSLRGIIHDLYLMSLCEFLVCTFSSNVGRAAFTLMQSHQTDASSSVRSLDDIFYFLRQNEHNVTAAEKHVARDGSQISLEAGDPIRIQNFHWELRQMKKWPEALTWGTNKRTGKTGMFPTYKMQDRVVTAKMPTYPQVQENKELTRFEDYNMTVAELLQ